MIIGMLLGVAAIPATQAGAQTGDPPARPQQVERLVDAQGPYEAVRGEPFKLHGVHAGFPGEVEFGWNGDAEEPPCTFENQDTPEPTLVCDRGGTIFFTVYDLTNGSAYQDMAYIRLRAADEPPPPVTVDAGGPYEATAGFPVSLYGDVSGFPAAQVRWSTAGEDLGCELWDQGRHDGTMTCEEPGETTVILTVTDLTTSQARSSIAELTVSDG